ncbi:hypothetical protein BJ912DRAFT_981492 [Pholiota molesta]|nr:hypothetical protein BJ912DRAFT_981492 [Pholiota molesta]
MSQLGISIDTEKSEISSALNSSLIVAFGTGMYTVIYFGTMYIYLKKNSFKRPIVPAIITVQFLCNIVQIGLQWYSTEWQIVDNGDTRDSVFMSLLDTPNWAILVGDISTYICFVLADVLLIWRCFFVWNRSFRVISISLFLLIIEIDRFNNLACAAFFMTFAASLLTTVLVAYRIHSASKEGISKRIFTHIINIHVLPGANIISSTWGTALGLSTTILVARVSIMLPTNVTFPSTSVHISGLQFHPHSTHQTDT